MNKSLHWEQRVALVRHNLHAASRTGDFTFFKALQAQGFIEGTNHVSTLSATLGDDADTLLSGLDDLNGTLAYMHQEAFKNVYNSLKTYLAESPESDRMTGRSKIHVDASMQKQMADHAIDKISSSAIALIKQQQESIQDTAANVWITGNTIIADCMDVCIKQIDILENKMEDFIRLEDSWSTVKASVGGAISALKGVFNLMAVEDCNEGRNSRPGSFSFSGGSVLRRLSNAFAASNATPGTRSPSISTTSSRGSFSFTPEYHTPNYIRNSVSTAMPTSLPGPPSNYQHTQLSAIPPTPAAFEDDINPFDTSAPPLPPSRPLPELRVSQAVI